MRKWTCPHYSLSPHIICENKTIHSLHRFCILSMVHHLDLIIILMMDQSPRPCPQVPQIFLTLPTPSCSPHLHPALIQFIVSIPYLDTVTASYSVTCLLLITLCINQFSIEVSDISKIKVQTFLVPTWPTHDFMWLFCIKHMSLVETSLVTSSYQTMPPLTWANDFPHCVSGFPRLYCVFQLMPVHPYVIFICHIYIALFTKLSISVPPLCLQNKKSPPLIFVVLWGFSTL